MAAPSLGVRRAPAVPARVPSVLPSGVTVASSSPPSPARHAKRMNNKEVKLAMRSRLSGKLADGELVLVDDYGFEKPSTKAAVAMLKALGLEGKRLTIIVAMRTSTPTCRSATFPRRSSSPLTRPTPTISSSTTPC